MTDRRADVVVVGAGVMGAAMARALARRGHRVTLLERFTVGHAHGSSHGGSRIYRFSYPEAEYVRMMQEALPLWRELEREAGEPLLVETGGLDVGTGLDRHVAALASCDVPFEEVDGPWLAARHPSVRLRDGERALQQPEAGIVLADRAWNALVGSAVRAGVELAEEVRVRGLDVAGDGVEVRTGGGTIHAGAAVVTAGAWARALLAPLRIDLPVRPTRETVAYFRTTERIPSVVEWGAPSVYALTAPGRGVKVGEHQAGPAIDPDGEGWPDAGSVARLSAWVRARLPDVDPTPALAETCLYTNASEDRFVLERHGPIVVGSACSGHGFKFAPLIGERLADLVDVGRG